MFCTKCGKQIADDSKFCEFCGEKFTNDAAPAAAASPVNSFRNGVNDIVGGKKDNKQLLMIGGIVLAALIVIIVLFSVLFGSSPKKAVKKYYERRVELMLEAEENEYSWGCEKVAKKLDVDIEDYEVDVKVAVKKVSKYDKDDDEFEYIKDYVDDELDGDGDKVKGVAYVKSKVTYTVKIDGDKDDDQSEGMSDEEYVNRIVVKIGGDWYMTSFTKEELESATESDFDLDDLEDYLPDMD